MEIIRGKHASFMDASGLAERLSGTHTVHIDIGTGDGRFVQHVAQADSSRFVIGIDACRENLQDVSRRAPANTLFVIANAQALPEALNGLASHISINFPWGSLLAGLLNADEGLLHGLVRISQPKARLEVRLNGGALAEQGWQLEDGAARIHEVLAACGFRMSTASALSSSELKTFPTTWAKRIAFGRDPHAMVMSGIHAVRVPVAENGVYETL
jgi:16S rRNA (adenine(1408)-N(1))-methyltransferase